MMNSDNDSRLHPNWRALATIHFPLKRFVPEESNTIFGTLNEETCLIAGVNGDEAQKFYHKTLQNIHTNNNDISISKKATSADKKLSKPKRKFVLFDKNNFFRYAMEDNSDQLAKFDLATIDVNMCDAYGWTVLMMAACEGAKSVVHMLLAAGANKAIADKGGQTAIDLAKTKGHSEIVKLLSSWEDDKATNSNCTRAVVKEALPNEPFYCSICKRTFTETCVRTHNTSTVHQFNTKSHTQANKLQKFNISMKNRGLQLMVKQGWDRESGLGPTQSGRLYPVKTVIRKQRTGLGVEQVPARVTHFAAYDLRATQNKQKSHYYACKTRNRYDIRREQRREWKVARKMSRTDTQKTIEILQSTEEVADKILVNKEELVALDKRRQDTREAIREIKKGSAADERKVWITVGNILVKMSRDKALELLENDQKQIEREINILNSNQKILVNKHRDLEHFSPYSGTNITAMDRKEFAALKANLPML